VFTPSKISFTVSYIVINSVYQDPVLVCVLQEQKKTIAVLQVQESSKNKTEKEREFGLQRMSAAEPFSGMGEMALRD
jgi:hypothetical protein